MKITIQQLRSIIKEEVTKAKKLGEAKLTPAETRKYFELLDDPKFKEFLRSSNMKLGRGERDVLSDIETDRMHRGRNPAHDDDDIELPARPTTKRPRRIKEAPDVDETELFILEFTFISPEDEENFEAEYPEYREEGFVLVCEEPKKCAKDFLQRTMAAGALTDYEFQEGTLIGTDFGVVLYGTPEELTQAGTTFARMDYELGGAGLSYDPSEAPILVREKMRPVE